MTNQDYVCRLRRCLKVLRAKATVRPLRGLLIFAVPILLTGCSAERVSFLSPSGPVASAQRGYFIDIILILLIVVVPVFLLTPLFAWRYRYRNGAAPYRPNWSFSWPLEILIWGVPAGVVVVLAIWLWSATHSLDPYRPLTSKQSPLQVEVVGYDWKWLFIYPKFGVASIGQFVMPVDRPVSIELTSNTVMQSFFIPALGSQIYAMAGMVTRLNLKADKVGSFLGENTQYNGDGFQHQKFTARSMTPEDFRAWVLHVKTDGIPLTASNYKILRMQNTVKDLQKALHADLTPKGIIYLRKVPRGLFADVVKSFHGGAPVAVTPNGATEAARPVAPSLARATIKAAKQD